MVLIIGLKQRILLDKKGRIVDWAHSDSIFRKEEDIAKDEEEELQRNCG